MDVGSKVNFDRVPSVDTVLFFVGGRRELNLPKRVVYSKKAAASLLSEPTYHFAPDQLARFVSRE